MTHCQGGFPSMQGTHSIHQSISGSPLGKIPRNERAINKANDLFGSILKNYSALCGKIGKCLPLNI